MFKPGDEVVCVDATRRTMRRHVPSLTAGAVYTVAGVFMGDTEHSAGQTFPSVHLVELPWRTLGGLVGGYLSSRFRKVERKSDSLSIEAFLTIKPGFEEPKRTNQPAKRKEQA